MAVYTYKCKNSECGIRVEKVRGISEPEPTYICDECSEVLARVYDSAPSIQFNGSGFYSKDKA